MIGNILRLVLISLAVYFGSRWIRRMLQSRRDEQSIPTDRSGVIRKITHHENGRMASERYLMDGMMHGPYMLWDHAGNKIAEGEYRNGQLHGMERRFGPDGRLIGEVKWEEGRRIETRKTGADGEVIELRLVDEKTAETDPEDEPS